MTDTNTMNLSENSNKINKSGYRRIKQLAFFLAITGILFFVPAGTIKWLNGWLYLGTYLLAVFVMFILMKNKDPELINKRGIVAKNVKKWDKVIMTLYVIALTTMPVIASLDAVRFGWSFMSPLWLIPGFIMAVIAFLLGTWAMMSNTHFETYVRIQEEREHKPITEGPYRFIRHPGYAGAIFFFFCSPFILGSWWSFIPCSLMTILFTIRTYKEDLTLQEELPGYKEYTEKVRYRLLPGIF